MELPSPTRLSMLFAQEACQPVAQLDQYFTLLWLITRPCLSKIQWLVFPWLCVTMSSESIRRTFRRVTQTFLSNQYSLTCTSSPQLISQSICTWEMIARTSPALIWMSFKNKLTDTLSSKEAVSSLLPILIQILLKIRIQHWAWCTTILLTTMLMMGLMWNTCLA